MSRSEPSDEQAWLPFDEFLASGAKPPAEARPPRGAANMRSASVAAPARSTELPLAGSPNVAATNRPLAGTSVGSVPTSAERTAARPAASSPSAASTASAATAQPLLQARIVTVTDLTRLVKSTLANAPGLRDVWVEGEVGQVTVSSAGHCYFTLKDQRASLLLHGLSRRSDGDPVRAANGAPPGRARPAGRFRGRRGRTSSMSTASSRPASAISRSASKR